MAESLKRTAELPSPSVSLKRSAADDGPLEEERSAKSGRWLNAQESEGGAAFTVAVPGAEQEYVVRDERSRTFLTGLVKETGRRSPEPESAFAEAEGWTIEEISRAAFDLADDLAAVSYTHLTLPTICSV